MANSCRRLALSSSSHRSGVAISFLFSNIKVWQFWDTEFDIDPNIIANVSYIEFRPYITVSISLLKKREVPIIPIHGSPSLFLSSS